MATQTARDSTQLRLLLLIAILFFSYLCVAISLPVVPLEVSRAFGFGNSWAGLAVGAAFFSTIVSRGPAGRFCDSRGGKAAVERGLCFYLGGLLTCMGAGAIADGPVAAYEVLLVGRLLIGIGESFVAVGVISWGIAMIGPSRSGKVLALVGASIYGALAVGGPIGLFLFGRLGFAGTMAASAVPPILGLMAVRLIRGAMPNPAAAGTVSFRSMIRRIWLHGAIVGLQGVGFAAIGAFFVLHFVERGWDHAALGLTAFGGGFVLVRILFGHMPDRFGGLPVAIASLATEAAGQLLIWAGGSSGLALAGAFLTGLGCSLIFPAMGREVVRLVEPHQRGTALGAFSAFQDLAYGVTGPLAGLLADRAGYQSVFMAGAIAAAAGFSLAVSMGRLRPAEAG